MTKRQYSDNDKATALAALDANGGNVTKTARETKIPASTITEWRDGRIHADVTDIRDEKVLELSELVEIELRAIFAEMGVKRATASYANLATAAGIFVDKKQLLAGKATERKELNAQVNGHVTLLSTLSEEELDNIIAGNPPSQSRKGTEIDTE